MLTILRDPAGITGRVRAVWDTTASVQANIERHIAAGGDAEVWWNGERIADPARDPRMDALPRDSDEVRVVMRPEGVETWLFIASLALAAYTYTLIPKGLDQQTAKQSPNNSLTGLSNIARSYQAIPDLFGYSRCWPDLIQQSEEVYIDNVKQVTEWLCVSRGTGDLTDIRYAETPITDIEGASYAIFSPATTPSAYPELNSTTITDVREPFACQDVNGQELGNLVAVSPTQSEIISITAEAAITSDFELEMVDGPHLDAIKALAPAGTVALAFSYAWTYDSGDGQTSEVVHFSDAVTVTAYSVSGGNVTFSLTAAASTVPVRSVGVATPPGVLTPLALAPSQGWLYGAPTTSAVGPFTLPHDADEIRWNVVFLRGLKGTVTIRAEWWQINDAGTEIGGTRESEDFDYTADSFDQQFFTTDVTPAAGIGRYRVQFTRQTADLGNGADTAKLEGLFALRHYPTKTLPGVTVVKIVTRATPQATGFKDRKFNARWQRHVRTLGSSALSASRNFARSMLHLWCVAGQDAAEFDAAALTAINSSIGEDSPLLRFDGGFDDADLSLGERLQAIANAARCIVWRDGQVWTVTRDQSRPTPEMQLDYRNLARGGESAISYAAHLPASFDGVELEYVEEIDQARKEYARLNITSGVPVVGAGANPKKLRLLGCRTAAQAEDRAQLEARKLLHQRVSVSDTALAEAGSLAVGSTVRWIDPADFAGDELQAGEVLAIDGSTITTSEPVDFKSQPDGRMMFTGVDGAYLGAPVVVTPAGDNAVTLASVPAGLYVRDGTTRQLGSRYVFGVGLSSAELEAAGLYTVTDIKPGPDRTVALSLANWDARIYTYDDPVLTSARGRAGGRGALASLRAAGIFARAGVRAAVATVSTFDQIHLARSGATAANTTAQPTDASYSSVSLLLHMDGSNGSTTFTDSGPGARTVTRYGNTQISTAQNKFGGASAYFDGAGDYLTLADNDAWHFGTGDFTIECWIRPASFPTSGQNRGIMCQSLSSSNRGFNLYIPPTMQDVVATFWQNDSTIAAAYGSSGNALSLNTWHHVAVVRDGSSFLMFIDGTLNGSASSAASIQNSTAVLDIGTLYSGSAITNSYFDGYIDEVRITKGVARYVANFTPPASPFPNA